MEGRGGEEDRIALDEDCREEECRNGKNWRKTEGMKRKEGNVQIGG